MTGETRRYGWSVAAIAFAVFALAWTAVFRRDLADMAAVWAGSQTYTHGFLIAPISIYLAWLLRRHAFAAAPKPEPLAAVAALAFGLVWLLGQAAFAQIVSEIGAIGLLISGFVGIAGRRAARALWFPLVFLFFMAPAGDSLIAPLQDLTARGVTLGLRLVGVPVLHDGVMLETAAGRYHVAEACAGVRFLIANIVIATLFAYLAYTKTWKRAAFLAFAMALPIVANSIRAFAIVWIATLTDNRVAAGVDHIVYGWGFFVAIMLAMLFVGWRFADRAVGAFGEAPAPTPANTLSLRAAMVRFAPILAAFAAAPVYAALAIPSGAAPAVAAISTPAVKGWARVARANGWTLNAAAADAHANADYLRKERRVQLSIAYFSRERDGAEAVYWANRPYDDDLWRRASSITHTFTIDGAPVDARIDLLRGPGGDAAAASFYWTGARITGDPRRAKLDLAIRRLTGRDPAAAMLSIAAPYSSDPDEAARQIQAFLHDLPPLSAMLAGAGER